MTPRGGRRNSPRNLCVRRSCIGSRQLFSEIRRLRRRLRDPHEPSWSRWNLCVHRCRLTCLRCRNSRCRDAWRQNLDCRFSAAPRLSSRSVLTLALSALPPANPVLSDERSLAVQGSNTLSILLVRAFKGEPRPPLPDNSPARAAARLVGSCCSTTR